MKDKITLWMGNHRWFLGFTGVFAVLMAYVFWGTWSPDVAAVMPDDAVTHPLSRLAQFRGWWNGFVSSGKFVPGDLISSGLVVSRYVTQEFKYAVAAYFSALGLAFFLRGRGLSQLASYGAGILLGFSGYWLTLFSAGHAGWFVWMTYGTFAFGFADRAVRFGKMRDWILLGACVAWASFQQPDLWLLFTFLTGVYTLAVCAWERSFPWKGMLLASLTFAVIGAPSVWGAFTGALGERDKQIAETVKPLSEAEKADPAAQEKAEAEARWIFTTNWSLPPSETAEFFIPRLNGDTSCPMTLQLARAAGKDTKPYTGALGRPLGAPRGNYRQHSLYVGFVTCLLALMGAWAGLAKFGRERHYRAIVAFFACSAVVCWLFALGRHCEIVYRLVYAMPFGDYLRAPVKWHHLTEFSLAVLAGFGLEWLRSLSGFGKPGGRAVLVLAVLVGAADLARIDRLYCAPMDLGVVRGTNAAAERIEKSGRGKLADLVENGNGLLAWSFGAHGVGVTGNPNDEGVRFIWVGKQQVAQNRNVEAYLKARTIPVGHYRVTARGVFSVRPSDANVLLYQLKDVPVPAPKSPWGKVRPLILAMGLVSVAGTLAVLAFALCKGCRERAIR